MVTYQKRVVACAVDKAHCVSMWGQDFRKEFGELAVLRSYINNLQFLAVTACNINKIKSSRAFKYSLFKKVENCFCYSKQKKHLLIKISTKTQFVWI